MTDSRNKGIEAAIDAVPEAQLRDMLGLMVEMMFFDFEGNYWTIDKDWGVETVEEIARCIPPEGRAAVKAA